jgi:hypothetical protein
VSSLADLDACIEQLDLSQPFPPGILGQPRGRTTSQHHVALPEGWLRSRGERTVPRDAELVSSGG